MSAIRMWETDIGRDDAVDNERVVLHALIGMRSIAGSMMRCRASLDTSWCGSEAGSMSPKT